MDIVKLGQYLDKIENFVNLAIHAFSQSDFNKSMQFITNSEKYFRKIIQYFRKREALFQLFAVNPVDLNFYNPKRIQRLQKFINAFEEFNEIIQEIKRKKVRKLVQVNRKRLNQNLGPIYELDYEKSDIKTLFLAFINLCLILKHI